MLMVSEGLMRRTPEITGEQEFLLKMIVSVIRWRIDTTKGEMIESRAGGSLYLKDRYMLNKKMSQRDLDIVCKAVNNVFIQCNSELRVTSEANGFITTFISS